MQLRIREEHKGMHGTMAEALQQLSLQTKEPQGLSTILDDFYTSRIGIRMILDQHIAAQEPKAGFTGIIADECSPLQIAMEVIEKVTPLWKQKNTKVLPEFQIHGTTHAKYRYIPQHIEIILSEVIKNAMRNSLQISSPSTLPPPINVLVSGGAHGVCIKVSDLGGGTTREEANQLFGYYGYRSSSSEKKNQGYDPVSAALDTRGAKDTDSFGLRIASLYARYFGGELNLMPMEGHGMDAYIYMNCLTEKSNVKGTRNHEN
jgi:pyruvate dehydrogenase kinase 2/3/4